MKAESPKNRKGELAALPLGSVIAFVNEHDGLSYKGVREGLEKGRWIYLQKIEHGGKAVWVWAGCAKWSVNKIPSSWRKTLLQHAPDIGRWAN